MNVKSYWNRRRPDVFDYFCAQCRSPRRSLQRPRPTPRNYAQVALTVVCFMLATWSWFGWKGVVAFVPFWIAFEVGFRIRTRAAAQCDKCGFDPFLYKVDVGWARREIEQHWRRKFAEKGIPFPGSKPATEAPLESSE